MSRHLLSSREVAAAKEPGRYADGGGLYLIIRQRGDRLDKLWQYRWRKGGRGSQVERTLGLGPVKDVTLADARDKAAACRRALDAGRDPKAALAKNAAVQTFGQCADDLIADIIKSFKNAKHRAQWDMTLGDTYCAALRRKPVATVGTDDVLAVLKPIWLSKPETASRIRGRIERVLDSAKARGLRSGDNPARWRGHLKLLLPAAPRLSRGHHRAVAWRDAPAAVARIRELSSVSARALEWTVLTACRTQEAVGARRSEIVDAVWIIPASRMKAGREHRIPLTRRCLEIFDEVGELGSDWLFPGQNIRKPLSLSAMAECLKGLDIDATVHGFRSTFRDWAGDATGFPSELAEQALAHVIKDKTEAAYRRGDALEKRRAMMLAWERYLIQPASNVVALRG